MNPINSASIVLFTRYLGVIKQSKSKHRNKIIAMCEYCIDHPDMHIDKMSRWLGFIQGVMYTEGLIKIPEERDFSRPLFHKAYASLNLDIPEKITL